MTVEFSLLQHPEDGRPMVSVMAVAGMLDVEPEALADNVGEWLYGSELVKRYWGDFVLLEWPQRDLAMTLDGLVALTGHLTPQFPRAREALAGLQLAMHEGCGDAAV